MKKIIPVNSSLIPKDAKNVFEGVLYDVYQWQQKLYDKSYADFEMLRRADGAHAICIVDDQILLIEDTQPSRSKVLSLPGGKVEPGETTLEGLKRELLEETGYEFENHRLVEVVQANHKIECFYYKYVAWGVKSVSEPQSEPGEIIKPKFTKFDKAKAASKGNKYMAESVFSKVNNIEDLKDLPEFEGQELDSID